MNKIQAILLFSIVFVAGCVGQGTTGGAGGPGCVMTGPIVNPSTAEPGTKILLDVNVENKGGAVCKDVRAELFGYPKNIITVSGDPSETIGDLYPADPSRGLKQGEQGLASWELEGQGRTVDVPYDVGVKVTFGYTTTLEGTIKAVTPEYLRRTNDKGGIDFKSTTGGPISLSLNAPSTVISGGKVFFYIVVSNNGAGNVPGDVVVVSGNNCNTKEVNVKKGRTDSVRCSIEVSGVTDFQLFTITASTSYTYSTEKVTTITILKNPVVGGLLV